MSKSTRAVFERSKDVVNETKEILIAKAPLLEAAAVHAERRGKWMQTFTNIQFWPLDPRPDEVCLEDIAVALSNECRFGGHVKPHYSVAQHCCLVAQHLPPELRAQGLMHDATEAYLKDLPSPIKEDLAEYKAIERRMAICIGQAFGLELADLPDEVHEQDARCLLTEKRDLRGPTPAPWSNTVDPWSERIVAWSPEIAETMFLRLANTLGIVHVGPARP